ncbi:hypothetical protein AVEN_246547-1 [Araneus ventricosus]|uniref:Uncharacterized protein n=1 Tax=Araneus ventricosus TaxID=182803 RepID=A0A4Y2TPN9_ARAVE|nr:hypothetical protein AVEN_246547-1 [Araneus ventricosus]
MEYRMMEPAGLDFLKKLREKNRTEKKERPPTEEEMNFCIKLQEQDSPKIRARQMLKRARKRPKKLNPNSEEGKKAMNEVERCNEALVTVNEILRYYGQCPCLIAQSTHLL